MPKRFEHATWAAVGLASRIVPAMTAPTAPAPRLQGERILILDDDDGVRIALQMMVRSLGGEAVGAATIEEAQKLVGADVACVLIDKNLGARTGLEFLSWLKASAHAGCDAVVITGYGNMQSAIEALRLGAADYLLKPIELETLAHRLAMLCERRRMIAERAQLQAQLMQNDRMAALGTLAAGVVHEINNPLTYVLSNLEFLVNAPPQPTPDGIAELMQLVEETLTGAQQMASVVGHIKSFSHHGEAQKKLIDLSALLEGNLKMSTVLIRHRARVVRDFHPAPYVMGTEFQLAQVFLNLLVNASHAIPEGRANENEVRVRLSSGPDNTAVVEVIDTGSGMPPEVLKKLFQPFFTTKPKGVGTGMGLTICRNIIEAHGGRMGVESTVGKGSTFRVTLPGASGVQAPAEDAAKKSATGARARLLLVDDDAALLASLERYFSLEHDVTTAPNGRAALELVAKGQRFDVIVADLMMPEVTGAQLLASLEKTSPELAKRVLFITAGALSEETTALMARIPDRVLEKPLDLKVLQAAIRRQL
jgi:two-component system, NtrC family, sensor kinase